MLFQVNKSIPSFQSWCNAFNEVVSKTASVRYRQCKFQKDFLSVSIGMEPDQSPQGF